MLRPYILIFNLIYRTLFLQILFMDERMAEFSISQHSENKDPIVCERILVDFLKDPSAVSHSV